MDINMEVVATLKPEEVNKIIKDYLEKQGYTVSSIKPLVSTRTVGHQMNEYEETVFTGIEAKIKVKPIASQDNSEKPHYKD